MLYLHVRGAEGRRRRRDRDRQPQGPLGRLGGCRQGKGPRRRWAVAVEAAFAAVAEAAATPATVEQVRCHTLTPRQTDGARTPPPTNVGGAARPPGKLNINYARRFRHHPSVPLGVGLPAVAFPSGPPRRVQFDSVRFDVRFSADFSRFQLLPRTHTRAEAT